MEKTNDTNVEQALSRVFKNGIEVLADKCRCGENIRLHTHTFGLKDGKPEVKFYVDCPKCGFVSNWVDTPDKCIDFLENNDTQTELNQNVNAVAVTVPETEQLPISV